MRVTFLAAADTVNSDYRAYQPAQELGRRGALVRHVSGADERLDVAALVESDIVHIHRYVDPQTRSLVERLRAEGVGIVWDNDDDVTRVPRSNPAYAKVGGLNGRRIAAQLAEIVRLADVVTTPSAELASQYRATGAADVRVIENYVPNAFADVKPAKHPGVAIAWIAALEHQLDYQQLRLRETLESLLARHADVRIVSIGLGLGLRSERYEHIPRVPFADLARSVAGCDIGIAPLVDIPWNRARSNVKLKEYGSAGLAWLASPVGAYAGMGEREGGRLVADEGWGEALEQLVDDAKARRKLAKRASKWAKGETIAKNIGAWEAALHDAASRARSRRM